MSAAPARPGTPTFSPPRTTPTARAHTGSVPMRMLARVAEVRRTAHSCTTKANTEQKSPRNTTFPHPDADNLPIARGSSAPATAVDVTAHTTSCTHTTARVLSRRPRVRRALAVTCTARTTAARMTRASPSVGVRKPPPETSSATPTTAATAATKYERGSHDRDAMLSSTGVKTRARLMSSPALVAEVRCTPAVSRAMIAACEQPSRTATTRPRPRGIRSRRTRQTTPRATAATRKRRATAGATPTSPARSLAATKLAPQTAATATRRRSTARSAGRRVTPPDFRRSRGRTTGSSFMVP